MKPVEYRGVIGYEAYRIGDDGSPWTRHIGGRNGRLGEWKPMTPHPNPKSGHLYVNLARDGKSIKNYIHRMVLEAFIGLYPPGLECRHKDGNPANNALGNLVWGTRQENNADAARHGTAYRGDRHFKAKLFDRDIPIIRELIISDMSSTVSVMDENIGILFGVKAATIRAVRKYKNWAWVSW